MKRSLVLHATLLTVALVAAYEIWTRPPRSDDESSIKVANLSPLDRLTYESPTERVEVTRHKDSAGDAFLWVKTTHTEQPSPVPPTMKPAGNQQGNTNPAGQAAPKAPPTPPARSQPIVTRSGFLGNETATTLMKDFGELSAIRELGQVHPNKLSEYGLDKAKITLTLASGRTSRTFRVGDRTFGNRDYFIEDANDHSVYVIRPQNLQNLESARFRLVEHKLHSFELADVDRIVVRSNSKSQELVQKERTTPAKAYWVSAAKPAEPKESKETDLYSSWVAKADRLRVMEFAALDFKPQGTAEFELTYYRGSKKLGWLQLTRSTITPGPGVPASQAGQERYYVATEFTQAPVTVSADLARDIARDLPTLLGR